MNTSTSMCIDWPRCVPCLAGNRGWRARTRTWDNRSKVCCVTATLLANAVMSNSCGWRTRPSPWPPPSGREPAAGHSDNRSGAEGRSRTGTRVAPQRFLRPSRLPIPPLRRRHFANVQDLSYSKDVNVHSRDVNVQMEATSGFEPLIGVLQTPALTSWPRRHGWSGRRDSNSRPSPWQGDALPLSHFREASGTWLCGLGNRQCSHVSSSLFPVLHSLLPVVLTPCCIVRARGLEPPQELSPNSPSSCRVCRFRHARASGHTLN